jgi:hypothetical protein
MGHLHAVSDRRWRGRGEAWLRFAQTAKTYETPSRKVIGTPSGGPLRDQSEGKASSQYVLIEFLQADVVPILSQFVALPRTIRGHELMKRVRRRVLDHRSSSRLRRRVAVLESTR